MGLEYGKSLPEKAAQLIGFGQQQAAEQPLPGAVQTSEGGGLIPSGTAREK
jgi:hypothetical protein